MASKLSTPGNATPKSLRISLRLTFTDSVIDKLLSTLRNDLDKHTLKQPGTKPSRSRTRSPITRLTFCRKEKRKTLERVKVLGREPRNAAHLYTKQVRIDDPRPLNRGMAVDNSAFRIWEHCPNTVCTARDKRGRSCGKLSGA